MNIRTSYTYTHRHSNRHIYTNLTLEVLVFVASSIQHILSLLHSPAKPTLPPLDAPGYRLTVILIKQYKRAFAKEEKQFILVHRPHVGIAGGTETGGRPRVLRAILPRHAPRTKTTPLGYVLVRVLYEGIPIGLVNEVEGVRLTRVNRTNAVRERVRGIAQGRHGLVMSERMCGAIVGVVCGYEVYAS